MKTLRSFEISRDTCQMTHSYMPGDFNLEQRRCGKLKPRVLRVSSHLFKINRTALRSQSFA